jgi:hypothetical protein
MLFYLVKQVGVQTQKLITMMLMQTMMTVHVPMILQHVQIRACGIVAMANVFQQVMFVMAHLNSVTQAGVLTVPMAQMKA